MAFEPTYASGERTDRALLECLSWPWNSAGDCGTGSSHNQAGGLRVTTTAGCLFIDPQKGAQTLREACEKLPSADDELMLDFSAVQRIDAGMLRSLEELVRAAGKAEVSLVLRGTDVTIYKVLKLAGLTSQIQFVN